MTAGTRPRTGMIVVLISVLALLAGGIILSNATAPRPIAAEASRTPAPSVTAPASARPTDAPASAWTFQSTPDGPEVTVEYELPEGLELAVGEYDGYLAFTAGRTSVPFGGPSVSLDRGLRVVDATKARPHFNNDRPLGEDAASFLQGLATNERAGSPELGPVAAAQLSRVPAWMVDLRGPDGDLVHLDAGGVSINLVPQSRLIVADIEKAIILVQVWAGANVDFDAWLAEIQPLLDSFRIDTSRDATVALQPIRLSMKPVPAGWRVAQTGTVGVGLAVGNVLLASNYDVSEVYRYDRATLESLGTLAVGERGVFPPDAQSLAPGTDGVWVTLAAQKAIGLLDPVSGEIVRRVSLAGRPYDLVEHEGTLWIIDYEHNDVLRMDLQSEAVLAEIRVERPTDVVVGEGAVWATVHVGRRDRGEPMVGNGGQVARIDPATNTVTALLDVGPRPYFLAVGFGSIWTGNATGASVSRIDAATNEVTTIPISQDGAFDIEVAGDSVWAIVGEQHWAPPCDPDTSFFVRIDPTTNTVRERIAFPCPVSLAVDGNGLWVSGVGEDGPVVTLFEPTD
jgi:hypothetical protein